MNITRYQSSNHEQRRPTFVKKHSDFVMTFRSESEGVESGELKIDEYGWLSYLRLKVNPVNGYWLGNFSILAELCNEKEERARYVCNKLKRQGKVFFKTKQGKQKKSRFYVLNFVLTNTTVVTHDFIERSEQNHGLKASKTINSS